MKIRLAMSVQYTVGTFQILYESAARSLKNSWKLLENEVYLLQRYPILNRKGLYDFCSTTMSKLCTK